MREFFALHPYLVGLLILGIVWAVMFSARKDLQKLMVWSGGFYVAVLSLGFIVFKIFFPEFPAERFIIPGYWDPNTLFNLGRMTGGYGIEDAIFMFLVGGIAAAAYEEVFGKRVSRKRLRHRPHVAIVAGGIVGVAVAFLEVNLIYSLIASGFAVALFIWIERPDLIKHSLWGGGIFLLIYSLSFFLFLAMFPNFVQDFYGLENLSGILWNGLPLEEYLYALSFGLAFAPIYEYLKDV